MNIFRRINRVNTSAPIDGRSRVGRTNSEHGFTLIELLVVIGIITIVSALIFADNNRFGGQALLDNLAYDIALSVREAQVYGISVRQTTAGQFNSGYGMHFNINTPALQTTYNLFADSKNATNQPVPDGIYEPGEDVSPSPFIIGRGFYITQLCVTNAVGEDCASAKSLDILYVRPEPDAYISINGTLQYDVGGNLLPSSYTQARIVVTSPRGDSMNILVLSNGQISVQ